jgi:glycosyltransferase involved in cell wall biosynthesis
MPDFPSVVVVLSTYNGAKFLSEQLDSLIHQEYQNLEVLVRDDGSTDSTCELLSRYASEYDKIRVIYGENVGVVASFANLLFIVPGHADYVAFCDQDDVWDKDKITRAVNSLECLNTTEPAMYCSALRIVGSDLRYMRNSKKLRKHAAFENSLVENIATGCTIALNKAALKVVAEPETDWEMVRMHDWWIYQIVSVIGTVVYDDEPSLSYRQHGNNVVGSSSGPQKWMKRIRRHLGAKNKDVCKQAEELVRVYGRLMGECNIEIAQEFLACSKSNGFGSKLAYAMRTPLYRQHFIDDLLLRVLIVVDRI